MRWITLLILMVTPALAHDEHKQQYDTDTLKWFKTLTNRDGFQCCDGSDSVTPSGWRIGSTGYQVQLHPGGPWLDVPAIAMVKQPNLLNEAHVWPIYDAMGTVTFRCFMPGAGG